MRKGQSKDLLQVTLSLFLIEYVRSSFLMGYLPYVTIGGTAVIAAGTAVTLHFFSDAVANAWVGSTMRLLKGKIVLHLGFVCCLAGLSLAGIGSTWGLLAGSSLLGIGIVPVWLTALCEATGENRGKRMAIVYFAWMSGLALGAVLSNVILDINRSAVFWSMVGMIVFAWLVVVNLRPSYRQGERRHTRIPLAALGRFVKRSAVLLPGIGLQGIATGMLLPLLPVFATQSLQLSHTQYGLLLAVGGIAAFVVILPLGQLADKIGQLLPVIAGFALCAVSLLLLTLQPHGWVVYGEALLLGLGYAVYLPAWNAFMARFIDTSSKEASWGIISSVQGVSVMIGPVIGGILLQFWSVTGAVMAAAVLIGMTALYYIGYGFYTRMNNTHTFQN